MHGILKSHENQLTNGIVGNNKIYKIKKSKLKAGIHHSTIRSWLAPRGKPLVNFGPDKKKVTLELEGEKERMEKFREAKQRYRNNQDVEAQLDNARRREEQLRNRRLLEEQLRNRRLLEDPQADVNRALVLHDADNVAPNRPKGGKKRKRKTRRKIKHKKRKTRRKKKTKRRKKRTRRR